MRHFFNFVCFERHSFHFKLLRNSHSFFGFIPFSRPKIGGYIMEDSARRQSSSSTSKSNAEIQAQKDKYLNMTIECKRKVYFCGKSYIEPSSIPTLLHDDPNLKSSANQPSKVANLIGLVDVGVADCSRPTPDDKDEDTLNRLMASKISIFHGDITRLEVDAIVNAANRTLLGGGGVDFSIHRAADDDLLNNECKTLDGCETGRAKITGGYKLPAKYVIHTVGPHNKSEKMLRSCYIECLKLMKEHQLKSLAFPCISTGVYGFPAEGAAHIALETVATHLKEKKNADSVDRIIFCVYLKSDMEIYTRIAPKYFPFSDQGISTSRMAAGRSDSNPAA